MLPYLIINTHFVGPDSLHSSELAVCELKGVKPILLNLRGPLEINIIYHHSSAQTARNHLKVKTLPTTASCLAVTRLVPLVKLGINVIAGPSTSEELLFQTS